MRWKLLSWTGRVAAVHNIAKFAASGGAVATAAGFVTLILDHPVLSAVIFTVAALLLFTAATAYIFLPPKGSHFPRYRSWYLHPLRKISWRLNGVGVHEVKDGRTIVGDFACSFKVNRGRIEPERFTLEFDGQTDPLPVTIQVGTEKIGCDQIRYIRKGSWNHCEARILRDKNLPDDGVTNHPSTAEFINKFGPFELIFGYDGKVFRRRYGQYELDMMIQGQIDARHPPATPVPILEDDSN
ncbi:MAG: hypothetical protein IH996_07235 [Proteobacteria bacterium]|nr:hypothetical protein [Pseudomonadota bacterium]